MTEVKKAIEYDFNIVNHWIKVLDEYSGSKSSLKGKTILELGPGADLGIGIIILMKEAKKYNALDINNLVEAVPEQFYEELFRYIKTIKDKKIDIDYLRSQLKLTQVRENDKLNYWVSKDFDISIFAEEDIDLVFSQAAFEHFDNIEKTISQLKFLKSGTILIAEVDLKTHTMWIRDLDPLNIYRYSDFIYNLFKFSGSPNRVRPFEYKEIFEKCGWTNIKIMPLTKLEEGYLQVNKSLNKRFQDKINQMDFLSIMICATKGNYLPK
ncbi:MAG: hypothetical protein ABIF11_08130 [Nitrospirota bacterium]